MKFVIEIMSGERLVDECLSRAIVDEISVDAARNKASLLLEIWSPQGANGARILSKDGNLLDALPHSAARMSDRAA